MFPEHPCRQQSSLLCNTAQPASSHPTKSAWLGFLCGANVGLNASEALHLTTACSDRGPPTALGQGKNGEVCNTGSTDQARPTLEHSNLTACALVQQSMAEDIETARAALRPWARRAEKQAARGRSISPRRTTSRRTPSADQGSLARQISTGGNAGGSGERSIQSYLARSSRDGDVPDLISQVRQGCCDSGPQQDPWLPLMSVSFPRPAAVRR